MNSTVTVSPFDSVTIHKSHAIEKMQQFYLQSLQESES